MSRDVLAYVEDISTYCGKVERFLSNVSYDQFCTDDEKVLAVVKCLEIIGEAVNNLSKSILEKYSSVEWAKIVSMRHILVHAYWGIDQEIVWSAAKYRLPELAAIAEEILSSPDYSE